MGVLNCFISNVQAEPTESMQTLQTDSKTSDYVSGC